jgi:SWIM/SEC-C metal-binding protein
MSRAEEIVNLCNEHGWQVVVGVEPEEPEDIRDIDKLLGSSVASFTSARPKPKVDRNALCPCGSGIKYKKCCSR